VDNDFRFYGIGLQSPIIKVTKWNQRTKCEIEYQGDPLSNPKKVFSRREDQDCYREVKTILVGAAVPPRTPAAPPALRSRAEKRLRIE
jgi:hypothetical protein